MGNDLIRELVEVFGEHSVLTGAALALRNSGFLDNAPLTAKALLLPSCTEDVAEMLRCCNRVGQAVVPHGGLTNLVYNTRTSPDEIAISLERMNAIEEIDLAGRTMTVQAGVTLQAVQQAASEAGLFFPLDLAPRATATIGGLIASNAGGTRVIRFGAMRSLVLGLEVVLADGSRLTSLNKMLKNNAGYDLKQIFVGSEGTLGVVTRAVLRLWPAMPSAATALLALETFEKVLQLLSLAEAEVGGQLTSYEVLWNDYYRLTTTPPAPSHPPLPSDFPYYVLLETLGTNWEQEQARFEAMLEQAYERHLFSEAVIARSKGQREALWRIREDSDQMEAQYQPAYSFDVSLPLRSMETYVAGVRERLEQTFGEVRLWVYGHVGDGNLHLGVWGFQITEAMREGVAEIIYQPLPTLGGSISAEHGIGLEKKAFLPLSRSRQEIVVMRRLKSALDPRGILNPGKIFDLEDRANAD